MYSLVGTTEISEKSGIEDVQMTGTILVVENEK